MLARSNANLDFDIFLRPVLVGVIDETTRIAMEAEDG